MASILLKSVSVEFPIYNLSARSLKQQLFSLTTGGIITHKQQKYVIVKALDNISFELKNGDRLGLIGHNGAGKSTLLRILAQIYEPTSGVMHVDGRIFPLFNLMLGFDQESTGYENIIMRGMLLGMSKAEINEKMDEIAKFTDLGHYLFAPIRTYSSGMQLRLAFAVTVSIQPEILLMDEVIGTGDAQFMEKAQKKLNELLEKSNIVVLASHSEANLKQLCNKALLLENGKAQYFEDINEAFHIYNKRQ